AAATPAFQAAIADPKVLANPNNAAVLGALKTGNASGISLDDSSFIGRLAPQLAAPFKVGFASSITHILLIAAAVTVIAFVLSFFVPEIPLRTISGLQSRLADDAAHHKAQAALADEAERLANGEDALTRVSAGLDSAPDEALRRISEDRGDIGKDARA
ncbi:MAG TPA: hypothetical protein VIK31_13720, partial [Propionibacteriaceae bacterium]